MKKILALLIFMLGLQIPNASAEDVWISTDDEIDTYIVTESIQKDPNVEMVLVVTKFVRSEGFKNVDWTFYKLGDMWRYETSEMDGMHTSVVLDDSLSGKILQYCLNFEQ